MSSPGEDTSEPRGAEAMAGSVLHQQVEGERGIPSINGAVSLQSRVNNVMAMGLMAALGIGLLTWYYTQAFSRPARTQRQAQGTASEKAKGEPVLRPLGEVTPPQTVSRSGDADRSFMEALMGEPPPLPEDLGTDREDESEQFVRADGARSAKVADRRLSGEVFTSASARRVAGEIATADSGTAPMSYGTQGSRGGASSNSLAELLEPKAHPVALASVLPTRRLLLAKGSFLDCTLETAIDSSLPGMTTCITATDTFGVDGSVVLLERGTKLIGETRGSARRGSSRVFVLWTEARTPFGIVIPLASPGTDELGRSGLPGEVDHHFMERFGAAILVSLIDGVAQGAAQSSDRGSTVVVNPSGSREIMTEILRGTIDIPPTVRKAQGDRIQVLVARDLDFRGVYELRNVAAER